MESKDRAIAIVCCTALACAAFVITLTVTCNIVMSRDVTKTAIEAGLTQKSVNSGCGCGKVIWTREAE